MKKAIGGYNSWQCPSCKKFIGSSFQEKGKCQFCGEELSFHSKTFGEDSEKTTQDKKVKDREVLEPLTGVVLEKVESDKLVIHTTYFTLNNNYYQGSKGTLLLPQKVETKIVNVSLEGRPNLFIWLKKYSEDKGFSMSEVMVGFVAKGVKHYLTEKKEAQKTQ